MKIVLIPVALLVAVFCLSGSAENSQNPDGGAEDVKKLAQAIVGTWSISEKDEPTPQSPNGETYQGQEIWSEPGGGAVMEQYHSKPANGDQLETALFWWDAKGQKFRGLWCAPFNDEGCNGFVAKWEGNQFVNDGEWEYQGKRRAWREVFVFPASDSFVQTLYIGETGAELKLVATIHGTKLTSGKRP